MSNVDYKCSFRVYNPTEVALVYLELTSRRNQVHNNRPVSTVALAGEMPTSVEHHSNNGFQCRHINQPHLTTRSEIHAKFITLHNSLRRETKWLHHRRRHSLLAAVIIPRCNYGQPVFCS